MIYTVDIYLKSGSVMRDVTVKKLTFNRDTVTWESADPNPLIFVSFDEVAGVVCTAKREEAA